MLRRHIILLILWSNQEKSRDRNVLTIESANENACTHVCDVIILRIVPLRLIPLGLSRAEHL